MKKKITISGRWILLGSLVAVAIFYWILLLTGWLDRESPSLPGGQESASTTALSKEYKYFSQLNGAGVESRRDIQPQVVGVMIDNHPDARGSQAGLGAAKVVYEALVEGGITRYLALFDSTQTAAKVGPIRSARPYFIDWLREYGDALYLHSGGSPDALDYIKKINLFDGNEFYFGKYYWRNDKITPPHNLFTSAKGWQELWQDAERTVTTTGWPGWRFATSTPASPSGEAVVAVAIPFSSEYSVRWGHQADSQIYTRSINNQPHQDEAGKQISAATVVVQFVPMKVVDKEGRRELATVGGGEARVFFSGRMIRGRWAKTSPTARTRFYTPLGEEIPLTPGKIWIEVVPTGAKLIVTN